MNTSLAMTGRHLWLLFALTLMVLMINIDYTALNLALVTMTHELNSTLNVMQWVLGGYMLAWAAVILPVGKAADYFGQKSFCLIGLILFIIGSVVAVVASSDLVVLVARFIQGISGAFYVPAIYALIFTNFPEERRGIVMGMLSLGIGLGAALGPTFGGSVLHLFGWRYIFVINIPIGILAFIIIFLTAKKDANKTADGFFLDTFSSLLLGFALIFFMASVSKVHDWGVLSQDFLGLMGLALLFFVAFVIRQNKQAKPMIPLSLFKNTTYLSCVLAILLEQYSFSACIVALALYFQKVLLFPVFKASLVFLALNVVFGAIAPFGGVLIDKIGLRKPALIGLFGFLIGVLGITVLSEHAVLWHLLVVLFVIGAGMALAFAALNSGIVKTVQAEEISLASSVFMLCALIGNTLGVAITTMLYEFYANQTLLLGVHAAMYATAVVLAMAWGIVWKLMRGV